MPEAEQSRETSTATPHMQLILFYGPDNVWPSHSTTSKFWEEAGIWRGDVNHNDGALQFHYEAYKRQLASVQDSKLVSSTNTGPLVEALMLACSEINQYLEYLHSSK